MAGTESAAGRRARHVPAALAWTAPRRTYLRYTGLPAGRPAHTPVEKVTHTHRPQAVSSTVSYFLAKWTQKVVKVGLQIFSHLGARSPKRRQKRIKGRAKRVKLLVFDENFFCLKLLVFGENFFCFCQESKKIWCENF
jgi:hypothetical protein